MLKFSSKSAADVLWSSMVESNSIRLRFDLFSQLGISIGLGSRVVEYFIVLRAYIFIREFKTLPSQRFL